MEAAAAVATAAFATAVALETSEHSSPAKAMEPADTWGSRSQGFPARDIWFLDLIPPGPDQMHRVLGKPSPPKNGRSDIQKYKFRHPERFEVQ